MRRHHDPRDDPPRKRRPEQYRGLPVTLGHIRSHGVRRLLIYCSVGLYCHHSAIVDADRWPNDTVLLDLDRNPVCTKCGMIGADNTNFLSAIGECFAAWYLAGSHLAYRPSKFQIATTQMYLSDPTVSLTDLR